MFFCLFDRYRFTRHYSESTTQPVLHTSHRKCWRSILSTVPSTHKQCAKHTINIHHSYAWWLPNGPMVATIDQCAKKEVNINHTHTFLYAYFLHRIHRRTFKIINVKCLTEYFCICFLIIRYRLNSASDEEDGYPVDEDFDEHLHYMAARERLQEFPGRIPQRKKKETSSQSEKKSRVSTSFFCLFLFY